MIGGLVVGSYKGILEINIIEKNIFFKDKINK